MDSPVLYVVIFVIITAVVLAVMRKERFNSTIDQALMGKPTLSIIVTQSGYTELNNITSFAYLLNIIQARTGNQVNVTGLAVQSASTVQVPAPYNGVVFYSNNGSSDNVQVVPFGKTLGDFWNDLYGGDKMPWNSPQ